MPACLVAILGIGWAYYLSILCFWPVALLLRCVSKGVYQFGVFSEHQLLICYCHFIITIQNTHFIKQRLIITLSTAKKKSAVFLLQDRSYLTVYGSWCLKTLYKGKTGICHLYSVHSAYHLLARENMSESTFLDAMLQLLISAKLVLIPLVLSMPACDTWWVNLASRFEESTISETNLTKFWNLH